MNIYCCQRRFECARCQASLYENSLVCRYKIELTEMQVLMGRLHDNWRHAYARGTSLMHIVDRFSISLQLDRSVPCAFPLYAVTMAHYNYVVGSKEN